MIVIIGCGLSGLLFAQKIKGDYGPLFFLDKARGVGGRMATRRWDGARFDHGTQTLNELPHDDAAGMTATAKLWAEGRQVILEKKVLRLVKGVNDWSIETEGGETFSASAVVLTAPLPQSLDILDQSQIAYPPHLKGITYHKAIIALVKFAQKHRPIDKVIREPHEHVEAVYDQMQKGVSTLPAWTVVFNSLFSEQHFEKTDEELLEMAKKIMTEINIPLPSHEIQIKKWRFARVKNPSNEKFVQVTQTPPLYLIGDALSGGDVTGAKASAEALAEHFRQILS